MNPVEDRIKCHPFFSGMEPEHVAVIVHGAIEKKFREDEVLFRVGTPASQFYLIESGQIALEAHEPGSGIVLVQTLGRGEVLGWSWLFPPFAWHFQARATEPTTAIVLGGGHLLSVAERDPAFGYALMKRVVQVVIQRLQATRAKLLRHQSESLVRT